ncbi:NUDIX hydrolase [Halobacterium bonnevillei]|uniref:NUDIX domain-containing protein n=1 Tax=Halobacterium bonnevillei TaxID=2692200 RepID=A0A6B0SES6_9EURY|nr:NUDIX hydrolase [Halobacterium bonnevillei]MXR20254.1 NUDIX domain-containing protein [Halobacterium bonnevillei]
MDTTRDARDQVTALLDQPNVNHVVNEWDVTSEEFEEFRDGWVAAGAVVRNPAGAVPFVEPSWVDGWVLPGGSVEAGETLAAAAERELREETGLDVEVGAPCRVVEQVIRGEDPTETARGWFVAFEGTTEDREFGDDLGVHDDEIDRVAWFAQPPTDTPQFVDAEGMFRDCHPEW